MKKSIVILISCMIFVQLHAQQNPTTSSSPEKDTTIVNVEVIQDLDLISESDADVEQTPESLPPEDMVTDSIPVVQIDSTQSPYHREDQPVSPNETEKEEEDDNENNEDGNFNIVVLDDFQTVQPLERKRTFLSFLSSLFQRKKRSNTEIINSTMI